MAVRRKVLKHIFDVCELKSPYKTFSVSEVKVRELKNYYGSCLADHCIKLPTKNQRLYFSYIHISLEKNLPHFIIEAL